MNNLPATVQKVLDEHLKLLETKLPNFLESYYLFGSIALGSFNEGHSDIDFMIVTYREPTEKDLQTLKEIHSELNKGFPSIHLDGIYLTNKQLENLGDNQFQTPYFNEGQYIGNKQLNKNHIDFFQLKKYGLVIKGKEIKAYSFEVDWDVLSANIVQNLNEYWLHWRLKAGKKFSLNYLSMLFQLESIEWGVLGVTRLYYSLREKDITSKIGAGEYALKAVPSKWHNIIQESMRIRKNEKKSYYLSPFKRRREALDYMDFVIREMNRVN
ncbi:nucleotidyltransferase domain-containing protein [Bacillus sp. 31A1R]|uniref:Nucleotidyltransferase domain-containing protein n=1 Tax=Robertmurraya mangrovi TaxID=3098077 RepID=A0ABU5J0Q1_9BACI|nr:nucleotidyltransferase domain-containing protein [Bacillus sp. 31A1R]MDZ5472979.1 nucleotidyltransferase domain-containing protein [Bacillus sp. 31A1R]